MMVSYAFLAILLLFLLTCIVYICTRKQKVRPTNENDIEIIQKRINIVDVPLTEQNMLTDMNDNYIVTERGGDAETDRDANNIHKRNPTETKLLSGSGSEVFEGERQSMDTIDEKKKEAGLDFY